MLSALGCLLLLDLARKHEYPRCRCSMAASIDRSAYLPSALLVPELDSLELTPLRYHREDCVPRVAVLVTCCWY